MSDADELYNREMSRLEMQQKGMRDNYNTETLNQNLHEYVNILNAEKSLPYAFTKDETLSDYIKRLSIYVDLAKTKNWKIHVLIGVRGKPWFTHKSPSGCFMCEDTQMIYYLLNILKLISNTHPDHKF